MKRLIVVIAASVFTLQSYAQTVTIGTQVWMKFNLDVSTFRNGDTIPEAKTRKEWYRAEINKQPAWCYYKNDTSKRVYGRLYNWYAVNDPRGLAPVGYHIPSEDEWHILIKYLGGYDKAGAKMKYKGWGENNKSTTDSGFLGLPGGLRGSRSGGGFEVFGAVAYWWSSTEYDSTDARCYYLGAGESGVNREDQNKGNGFSVRCVRD